MEEPAFLWQVLLHLAILYQLLLVFICLSSSHRMSAIMMRTLRSVVGIIVQHLNERFHSACWGWVYVALNCLLWHISLQRADVNVFQRKELLLMALRALSHNVCSECLFGFPFLLHLIYMSNSNDLYYLLKEKRMGLLQIKWSLEVGNSW